MDTATGIALYVGTQIGDRWWKRYRAPGFFVRGRGRYWFEDGELRFHRELTKELTARVPSRIPLVRRPGRTRKLDGYRGFA